MNIKDVEKDVIQKATTAIRILSAEGVQKANSGHPGLPMGMADCAFVLWSQFLNYNPKDPQWYGRDRFILSAGHGSMLVYTMLHLSGYDLSIDDLKQFRQLDSKTPGHPEFKEVPGVETTTGPLGQGFSNGVGMAIASKMQASHYNVGGHNLFDYRIFAIVSDGDLMEGVTAEAASIAGHLKLGNLVYLYDDNQITIEGSTQIAFTDDTAKRFESYGWQVLRVDGHKHQEIAEALQKGVDETEKPTLIIAKTTIGFGSPNKAGTAGVHGSPLGPEELENTKKALDWPLEPEFYVPEDVREVFAKRKSELLPVYEKWTADFEKWQKENPDLATQWDQSQTKQMPEDLEEQLLSVVPDKATATRALGGIVLNKAAELLPFLCGGSADLSPSTKTDIKNSDSIQAGQFSGRNFHFGIREHAMGSLMNGMALCGSFIPYGSTFLVFADYMRPPIRLASIMGLQSIFVFTHDSLFVGEDGPTHQPVEQIASLRAIPGVDVFRPADGTETAMAWAYALRKKDGPTTMCLTRQNVPPLERAAGFDVRDIQKGGYILSKESGAQPDVILVATGSEVSISIEAKAVLGNQSIDARVVSMPSLDVFQNQDQSYQDSVIPVDIPVVVVEAGIAQGWHAITRAPFLHIGMDSFGVSGPYELLAEKYGFTGNSVALKTKTFLD